MISLGIPGLEMMHFIRFLFSVSNRSEQILFWFQSKVVGLIPCIQYLSAASRPKFAIHQNHHEKNTFLLELRYWLKYVRPGE
jgi:hypothetical protein